MQALGSLLKALKQSQDMDQRSSKAKATSQKMSEAAIQYKLYESLKQKIASLLPVCLPALKLSVGYSENS